jgi:type I restriction enzyme M protein
MITKPFASEYEIQHIMQRCHTILWERHGYDPAQAFDELSKLLFVKLYAESRKSASAMVQLGPVEGADAFAARVRDLFGEANQTIGFAGIFEGQDTDIQADAIAIQEVLKQLQGFGLKDTTSSSRGADIKGTAYESILGSTFRGDLGQFFTHRSIVDFMVRMANPCDDAIVYDPACGSGGFLVMCGKLFRERLRTAQPSVPPPEAQMRVHEYSGRRLLGTEINERTARVAKLNLLMHDMDFSGIFCANALHALHDPLVLRDGRLREGGLDLILANPPFAGYEKDPQVLQRFELGRNGRGGTSAVTREVLFIEQIIRLLRPGGIAGIVIPQGIFSNRSLQRTRDYIFSTSRVLAIIELPDWAFIPSGTSVRGSLLFIERKSGGTTQGPIYMRKIGKIGFTSTGRPSSDADFREVLVDFANASSPWFVDPTAVKGRFDAKFYLPDNRLVAALFRDNTTYPLVALRDLGTFDVEKVNPKSLGDRKIAVIETSGLDPDTGQLTGRECIARQSSYSCLKVLRAGDVLISRRRTYRRAVTVVPQDMGNTLAIPEFSVLRLGEGVSPDYVCEMIRSDEFAQLMTIFSTGEMSGRVSEADLKGLKIPFPPEQEAIGRVLRELRGAARGLANQAESLNRRLAMVLTGLIHGKRLYSLLTEAVDDSAPGPGSHSPITTP